MQYICYMFNTMIDFLHDWKLILLNDIFDIWILLDDGSVKDDINANNCAYNILGVVLQLLTLW